MHFLHCAVSAFLICSVSSALANDDKGTLIFEDAFERNESQEVTEEIGNGWASNSKKRAGGNKQVDLIDGTMAITLHESADHGVSVTHSAEFQDGSVELKFKLEDKGDQLGLNFADLKFKEVHAGHLCAAKISTSAVLFQDLKTGIMARETRKMRKAGELTKEQAKELKTKSKRVNHALELSVWHDLLVNISGDELTVSIDGKKVGSLVSPGIAHPTKRTLRLAVPKKAIVDDIKIWKTK